LRLKQRLARFALVFWTAAILVSAAYLPRVRIWLGEEPGGGWRLVLAVLLVGLTLAALALALMENRNRVGPTLLRLTLPAVLGAVGLTLLANPDPRSRFIEAAHLGEYGILAVLAFLATAGQRSLLAQCGFSLAVIAAVGLVDESLQWLLPARAAEIRDVALNAHAGAIGLGYAVIVFGASREVGALSLAERERRDLLLAAASGVLALGFFLHAVHRGHLIRWGEIEFVSMFPSSELERIADERRARWAGLDAPGRERLLHPERRSWGIEDFYATEALRHIQARNEASERGETPSAAAENRLLERWYAPFLDATGARVYFEPEPDGGRYRSPALGHLWPWLTPFRLWVPVAATAGALTAAAFRAGARG
jgi:VanZ family protein